MEKNYRIRVREHHEDHTEDERTGGEPVSVWDNEYFIDAADIAEGEVIRVSPWTAVRILEVHPKEGSAPEIRVSVTVGSSGSGIEEKDVLSEGHTMYLWDPLRWCDKYLELITAE